MTGRVIVGVDGSPGSLQALRCAVGHARAFGATLIPVIAWMPPGGDSAQRRYPPFLIEEWAEDAERRLLTAFDEGLGGPPAELPTQPLVIRGPAGRVLVSIVDGETDLLVVGRGRQGRVRRLWYGSVSRYCLARALCPVITVPPNPLAAEVGRPWAGLRLRRAPATISGR